MPKIPKPKKLTKSSAKKKAWSAFSLYIRNKYATDGMATCYTCGALRTVKQLQAGHAIPGRSNAVLFMEEVVRPQDMGCNFFGRGKLSVFTPKLIKEIGLDRYNELSEKATQLVKYSVQDYLDIEIKFKEKLKQLEKG